MIREYQEANIALAQAPGLVVQRLSGHRWQAMSSREAATREGSSDRMSPPTDSVGHGESCTCYAAILMHLVTWSFWSGLDTQRPTWRHFLYRHLHVLISCLLRTHSSLRTLFRKFDSCVLRSPLHRIGNNDNLKTVELSPCAFSMCFHLRTRIIDNHRVERCK